MFQDLSKVIIFSDLDGTLLDSKKNISDCDIRAIEKFTSLGGQFTVATGRTVQTFEQYRKRLKITVPVILFNGSLIYDYGSKETLYINELPHNAPVIADELLNIFTSAGGEVLKADGTYVFRNNEYEQLHTDICNIVPKYSELKNIDPGGWLKVLFAMSPQNIPEFQNFVSSKNYGGVEFVKSADIFCEMLTKGITKGSALNEYRKIEKFKDFTFVSIGDFDNDIEMIQQADFGVCPANAQDNVKSVADLVLENTNDTGAVAELIEYIINN